MRKSVYFAVPIVLLVLFFAFLRALDPRSEERLPAGPVVAPPASSSAPPVDLLKLVNVASTGDLYLGQSGGGGEFYRGDLREVAVWSRGLRDADVARGADPEGADGYWPLDGRTPDVVTDASAGANHGIRMDGVRVLSEPDAKSYSFDGTTGFVRIPRSRRLEGSAVSVSCWIRRARDEAKWANVVRKTWFNNLGPTFMSWSLQLNPDEQGPGNLAFNTGCVGGYHRLIAKGAIPEGRWTRVVAVYDPASEAPQKRLYVDGALIASAEERRPICYDSVGNQWRFEGKDLVSPEDVGIPCRLAVPVVLPEEYDLTLVARRVRGIEALHLGLRCGSSGCVVVLDALDKGEYRSGIDRIEGRGYRENSSTVIGPLITTGRAFTLTCAVRRRRITVSLDGRPVLRWEGDPAKLSTDPFFAFPKADAPYVGSWESTYRISTLSLTPVSTNPPDGR